METTDTNYTEYAPAERDSLEQVQNRFLELLNIPEFKLFTDSIPDIFLVMNDKRQIVYANSRLLEFLELKSIDDVLGKRPGEILNCKYSNVYPGGCGTTLFCSQCAAVNAILDSLNGIKSVQECSILAQSNFAYEFKVWATPFEYQGVKYSIFAVRDISHEKRRYALEKIFFHDILNTVNGLVGLAKILKENPEEIYELKDVLLEISNTLFDEINSQKMLLSAETGKLILNITQVNSLEILNSVKNMYCKSTLANSRSIEIDHKTVSCDFLSDRTLLLRSLGNLVKNALEAIPEGEKVRIGADLDGEFITFWVQNPGGIPFDGQLQIFQRSFTTKGVGRGLGTYSTKLLCENFLKGKVYFVSDKNKGTIFYITLKISQFAEEG
ncbi:MAG: HAMP domain-containing histidine kinase [Ignavibacteria bacterium]|nr:HAMP domain-containing histidine kinase [Ignavibacteria bacterium]